MRFTTIVLKSLWRARARSLLTVAGVAVAIGSLVALVGIALGFVRSTLDIYERRNVDLVVTRAGAAQGLTSSLDQQLAERIRALSGVREVTSGVVQYVSFEERGLMGVMLLGWEFDSPPMRDVKMLEGRRLQPGDTRHVMVGSRLAANLETKVGETLEVIADEPCEVVGIFESLVFEDGALVVPLAELQRMMGTEGLVTGFSVSVERPMDEEQMRDLGRQIEGLDRGVKAETTLEFAQTNSWIRAARGMAWVTSLVALVIGAAGMLNTMLTSVLERTREIGVLRAIGWRKRRIGLMILLESLVLSLAGAALGSLGAVVLVRLLVRIPQLNQFVDGRIGAGTIAAGVAVAVAFAILGGAYPAHLGMRMQPAAALRS